jgi:hypothetical protein
MRTASPADAHAMCSIVEGQENKAAIQTVATLKRTATVKTHGEQGVFWLNTPLVHCLTATGMRLAFFLYFGTQRLGIRRIII